jgi:hypothetical protein
MKLQYGVEPTAVFLLENVDLSVTNVREEKTEESGS